MAIFKVGDRVTSVTSAFAGERVVDRVDGSSYTRLKGEGWAHSSGLMLAISSRVKKGDRLVATRGKSRIEGTVTSGLTTGAYVDVLDTEALVKVAETWVAYDYWAVEVIEPPAPTNADILNGLKVGGVVRYGGTDNYVKVGNGAFVRHTDDLLPVQGQTTPKLFAFGVTHFPDRFKVVEVTE